MLLGKCPIKGWDCRSAEQWYQLKTENALGRKVRRPGVSGLRSHFKQWIPAVAKVAYRRLTPMSAASLFWLWR